MPRPVQMRIPVPCHEDWNRMEPNEKGRHCLSCQKTVVDFTIMSDAEIVQYMKEAKGNVCGRLRAGQMNRDLTPAPPLSPVQMNGGRGWTWLLAGIMLTNDGAPSTPQVTLGLPVLAFHEEKPVKTCGEVVTMGDGVLIQLDTVEAPLHVVGELSITPVDELPVIGDTIAVTQPVDTLEENMYMGKISLDTAAAADTATQTDTRTAIVDTVRKFIKDTTSLFRSAKEKEELKIYPNPIRKGNTFQITWPSTPGVNQVRWYSASGALVQVREVEVNSLIQTYTWEVPGHWAAGIYIVQVIRPGQAETLAQKIIVE